MAAATSSKYPPKAAPNPHWAGSLAGDPEQRAQGQALEWEPGRVGVQGGQLGVVERAWGELEWEDQGRVGESELVPVVDWGREWVWERQVQ